MRSTILDRLLAEESIVYVAGRLFNLIDKQASEMLDRAVRSGIQQAAGNDALLPRTVTYVPFRDVDQESIIDDDKTHLLYKMDLERLDRTDIVVTLIEGLSKDEGVCFELGYAAARRSAILLITSDFFKIISPVGQSFVLDPWLEAIADRLIHQPELFSVGDYEANLAASSGALYDEVSRAVAELVWQERRPPEPTLSRSDFEVLKIYVETGGSQFEWQRELVDRITAVVQGNPGVALDSSRRYIGGPSIGAELSSLFGADLVITCVDGDDAPAGAAFAQGVARGNGKKVWMLNTKKCTIGAQGGYTSSRNLMIEYSADATFTSFDALCQKLKQL